MGLFPALAPNDHMDPHVLIRFPSVRLLSAE